MRLISDPHEVPDRLEGHERTLYEDHVGAAAAHHLALVRDRDACYVVFRRDRRKGLPLFASLIYVGNPALFQAGQHSSTGTFFFGTGSRSPSSSCG